MELITLARLFTYILYTLSIFPTMDLYRLFSSETEKITNPAVKRVNTSIIFLVRVIFVYQFLMSISFGYALLAGRPSVTIVYGSSVLDGVLFLIATIQLKKVLESIAKNGGK